jgi:hypothetical protein
LLSIRKYSRKYFFYTDIIIYRRDIKYNFLFNFSTSELKLNIFLISDSVLDSLLFLNLISGDSKSISILFKFITALVSFWSACNIAPTSRWFIYIIASAFRCPASAFRWLVCHAALAFRQSACNVVSVSRWSICFVSLISRWSAYNTARVSRRLIFIIVS